MAEDVRLKSFPSDRYEALALLYMENQSLKGKTPTELLEMYWAAYKEICNEYKAYRKEKYRFRD